MEVIFALIIILVTAFMFAPLGLGGGFLFVPTLYFILGWDLQLSIVCSLILVWFVSIGSRIAHDEGGYTVADVGRKGRIVAIGGAIIGALAADQIIAELSDDVIKLLAVFLLTLVIYRGIKKLIEEQKTDFHDEGNNLTVEGMLLYKYKLGCLAGGVSAGLIGIGGGVIFTMLNRIVLGLEPHRAAGTSYLIVMRVVPVAIFSHLLFQPSLIDEIINFDALTLALPLIVLVTAWAGAKTAIRMLPQRVLTYPYLLAVSLSLIRYLIDVIESLN
ncbi:MAG: sulfite exporter TauE/SafE family protein [Candidatus Thermoplasmatota archaeon]|nr:sulfite exporter TauE/SafE family protein [Candidatus Thermoplasmatota archaeon]